MEEAGSKVNHRRRKMVIRPPKGAYSSRGRSRHLLETAFSEPLLRTLLRTPFYCKTHSRPPFQNPSENPSPEPSPEPSQNPSQNAVLPYDPLGVHPKWTVIQALCIVILQHLKHQQMVTNIA